MSTTLLPIFSCLELEFSEITCGHSWLLGLILHSRIGIEKHTKKVNKNNKILKLNLFKIISIINKETIKTTAKSLFVNPNKIADEI